MRISSEMERCAVVSLLFLVGSVVGNPSGAPTAACGKWIPGHGVDPQDHSSLPFELKVSRVTPLDPQTGNPGNITVTIRRKNPSQDVFFKGFVVTAHRDGQPYGSFYVGEDTEARLVDDCPDTAITHIHIRPKDSLSLTWLPPSTDLGGSSPIVFNSTIVEHYKQFWVGVLATVGE